ncbi:hypothetical protein DFQ10_108128 [Winogradskyella eximia]|uniref:Uncharacterized protein n=1 Tax=Winogradskyella eximia TaxID=262006 RepID=A0A3D9H0P7_9FLAO|nr:hypothetical protein [Winogradskyella eximia]RED42721.1 hypothetical protein DFQ10_108128 [Winogradskyella eximia]
MKLVQLIELLNKAESENGYENYDDELAYAYGEIFGKEKLDKVINSTGWPKDYHFCWDELIIKKLNNDLLNSQKYLSLIKSKHEKFWITIDLIKNALFELSNSQIGIDLIDSLQIEDLKFKGYRLLLKYYALNGDLINFKNTLAKCDTKKGPRDEIYGAKGFLLSALVNIDGFHKTYELSQSNFFKNKSTDYILDLTVPMTKESDIEKLDVFLNQYPELEEKMPTLRQTLYIELVKNNDFNQEFFNNALIYLEKIPKKDRYDWDVFELAVTTKNLDLIKRCKKVLKTPTVRKELNKYIDSISKN